MKVTPVKKNFRHHKPGDVFDLPDRAAAMLIRVGMIAEYKTAELKPEPIKTEAPKADPEISERTGQPKRQYRRRDLTAEE